MVALIPILIFLPIFVSAFWLRQFPGDLRTFFIPVEVLGILVPALLLSWGTDRAISLRWRRTAPLSLMWAAIAAWGWGGLLTFAQTGWERVTGITPPAGIEDLLAIHSPYDLAILVVGAAMMPAICEETAFRGLLLSAFAPRGPWVAIGATTVLFAVFHQELYGVPTYLGMGIFLGWLAWRTGSLWPGCVAHFANNILALTQVNALPEDWWWAHAWPVVPICVLLAGLGTWRLAVISQERA